MEFTKKGHFRFCNCIYRADDTCLTPSQPTIDLGLFIRCFRDDAWYASLIIISLVIVAMLVPFFFLENWDSSDSVQISATSGWYFFVLLNAFYGGALTMFFASEAALPFDSIRGVMREYPGSINVLKPIFIL